MEHNINPNGNITPQNLTDIRLEDEKVITTDLLALFYETEPRRITENFNRNIERYTEGVHYHKLEAQALKDLKSEHAQSVFLNIPKNINVLYLWTKRGTARHAKILGTDKAWDVFDELEEHYFESNPNMLRIDLSKNQPEVLQLAANLSKQVSEQNVMLEKQKPLVMIANDFLTVPDSLKLGEQVAKELGYGKITLFRILREEKVLFYSRQGGQKINLPYRHHEIAGRFVVKNRTIEVAREDGSVKKINRTQVYFTPKGEAYVCAVLERRKARLRKRKDFFDKYLPAPETV